MTYDDVAEIKAALQAMVLLLQRIEDQLRNIDDHAADIATALTPDAEPPP